MGYRPPCRIGPGVLGLMSGRIGRKRSSGPRSQLTCVFVFVIHPGTVNRPTAGARPLLSRDP